MQNKVNQVALLNNYITNLEGQLESYKKQIETFIKYYDIFQTYDSAIQNLKNSNDERSGILATIRSLENQVERLKPLQEKYLNLFEKNEKDNDEMKIIYEKLWFSESKVKEYELIMQRNNLANVPTLNRKITELTVTYNTVGVQTELLCSFQPNNEEDFSKDERLRENQVIWNLKNRIVEMEKKNSDLTYYLNEKDESSQERDKEIQYLKEKIKRFNGDGDGEKMKQNGSQLRVKNMELEYKILEMDNVISSQQQEIQKLKTAFNQERQSVDRLKAQKKELVSKGSSNNIKSREIVTNGKVSALSASSIPSQSAIGDQYPDVAKKDKNILEEIIEDQQKYISDQRIKIEDLKESNNRMRDMIETLEKSNTILKGQIISAIQETEVLRKKMIEIRSNRNEGSYTTRQGPRQSQFATMKRSSNYSSHSNLLRAPSEFSRVKSRSPCRHDTHDEEITFMIDFVDDETAEASFEAGMI